MQPLGHHEDETEGKKPFLKGRSANKIGRANLSRISKTSNPLAGGNQQERIGEGFP